MFFSGFPLLYDSIFTSWFSLTVSICYSLYLFVFFILQLLRHVSYNSNNILMLGRLFIDLKVPISSLKIFCSLCDDFWLLCSKISLWTDGFHLNIISTLKSLWRSGTAQGNYFAGDRIPLGGSFLSYLIPSYFYEGKLRFL